MKKTRCFSIVLILIMLSVAFYLQNTLYLFISSEQGVKYCFKTIVGETLKLQYTHSVQKTPVDECFVVVGLNDLMLYSTRYQSYGVGLPWLSSEGSFSLKNKHFELDKLERHFSEIKVRTGNEAKLSVYYNGQVLPLYRDFPPGTLVHIKVGRYYERWLNNN